MKISVEVPIEQGEVIAQALERAAQTGDSTVGIEFTTFPKSKMEVRDSVEALGSPANGWPAQQADALVAMAKSYLMGGDAREKSSSAADHYQVVLHSDRSALHGGVGRSDLPIETLRRLTCDGSVITLVEDENGTPLDVGRKQRTISTALRRALWARDSRCSFPGCQNRYYVDAHHIEHRADGGDTSLENLTLLCTQHHALLHEGGFKLRRDAAGELYFQRPDGRAIPRFGYRLDDLRDDYVSAENPSMEVREPRAVYRARAA